MKNVDNGWQKFETMKTLVLLITYSNKFVVTHVHVMSRETLCLHMPVLRLTQKECVYQFKNINNIQFCSRNLYIVII